MPQYSIAGGSRRVQLAVSKANGEPFWVVTTDNVSIPLAIRSYDDTLGQPASTGNTLMHAEAELIDGLADPSVILMWPGHHSLELTFDEDGHLIGLSGQV